MILLMRRSQRALPLVIRVASVLLLFVVVGCGLTSEPETCAAPVYSVRPQSVILQAGVQEAQLIAYRSNCDKQPEPLADVRWSSSNPLGVSVDSTTGIVRGLRVATAATITARVKIGPADYRTQPGLTAEVVTNASSAAR